MVTGIATSKDGLTLTWPCAKTNQVRPWRYAPIEPPEAVDSRHFLRKVSLVTARTSKEMWGLGDRHSGMDRALEPSGSSCGVCQDPASVCSFQWHHIFTLGCLNGADTGSLRKTTW